MASKKRFILFSLGGCVLLGAQLALWNFVKIPRDGAPPFTNRSRPKASYQKNEGSNSTNGGNTNKAVKSESAVRGKEVLPNGGFENGPIGVWSGTPMGVKRLPDEARSGEYCLQVDAQRTGKWRGQTSRNFEATVGQALHLSGWVKFEYKGIARLYIAFYDDERNPIHRRLSRFYDESLHTKFMTIPGATDGYVFKSGVFVTPHGAQTFRVFCDLTVGSVVGSAYFDDVSVVALE